MPNSRCRGQAARSPRERGAALVELAISLPILAVILVGTIDFGRAFRTAMVITDAVRAGAQYGSYSLANSADAAGTTAAAAAVLAANGLSSGPAPVSTTSCGCLDEDNPNAPPSPIACPTPYPCSAGSHLVVDVTVTAARTFSLANPFPGIPNGIVITRSATMRVVP